MKNEKINKFKNRKSEKQYRCDINSLMDIV